ncbi:type II toxin-antitoxin system RelE/ParE family toxin [Sphingomonas sp. CFBP 8760]|uniref:type II toxin-antitoxin system RelE/ParE family toxin n=1 Tax=Sphingomonas sp. CFBP 8760 TaxID=2775282 RepID=UPI0017851F8F|nr:type II toxin-antitoxin system RelE/ParE family toxin [Sphingomonas sp. CFBP 8760]
MRIVRRPAAQDDIDALWSYTARHDIAAADRVVDRIVHATERLRLFPRSGRDHDDWQPGLRSVPASPYIVFYRVSADRIEIVRVLHGARDVPIMTGLD